MNHVIGADLKSGTELCSRISRMTNGSFPTRSWITPAKNQSPSTITIVAIVAGKPHGSRGLSLRPTNDTIPGKRSRTFRTEGRSMKRFNAGVTVGPIRLQSLRS